MLPDIQPGNTKILYFFNCLLDGMHTKAFCRFYLLDAKSIKNVARKKEKLKNIFKKELHHILTKQKNYRLHPQIPSKIENI